MAPAVLHRTLSAMCHSDRMRRLVELGRQARSNTQLARALAALEKGGFHKRLWSLHACFGSRDVERIARGLVDPSRQLRARAAHLLTLMADDETVGRGLAKLTRRLRITTLGRLRATGRLAPIDAHLDELARIGDRSLEVLLPYGSEKALNRHLAVAIDRGGVIFYARLARLHPQRAITLLDQRLRAARCPDPELTRLAQRILPTIAKRLPDEAVTLAGRLARLIPLATLPLQELLRRRPVAVAQLALNTKNHRFAQSSFNAIASRLPRAMVLQLAEQRLLSLTPSYSFWGERGNYGWLKDLPSDLRGELFTLFLGKKPAGVTDVHLLALLPANIRTREARRCMTLKKFALQPASRLPYVAYLDWGEATKAVERELAHPEGDRRATAIAALAGVVKFQRHRAADYLALVRARKHEQDPVRLAMMQALVRLPPVVWKAEHLDDLGGVIRDALDARDLSPATLNHVCWLVSRQLANHPEWAVHWLTTIARERRTLAWQSLEWVLTDQDVRRMGKSLLPVLKASRKSERDGPLLALARVLGRRLRVFGELIDLLEALARSTRNTNTASQAMDLIAIHAPERMHDLVPRLLRQDKTWFAIYPVAMHLHRHRQDLLTPYLTGRPISGRFSTGKVPLAIPFTDGMERWNGEQSRTFADTLTRMLEEDEALCLSQLAAIPGVAPTALIRQASSDDNPALRDQALTLLGRLDEGTGVGTLIEALGDARGRVAIYALRRAFLDMLPAHVMGLLRHAPMKKVTVAKEIVRLAGEMNSEDAYNFLLELDTKKLHRDVRSALLRALWTHLERDESWAMIDRAVQGGDPALMHTVVRIPADRLSLTARDRLFKLLMQLMDHPDPEVQRDVLTRLTDQPVNDPERVLFTHSLKALHSPLPDIRRAAVHALSVALIADDAEKVAEKAQQLLSNRPAINALVIALTQTMEGQKQTLGKVGRAVLEPLANDPVLASLRLQLAQASLSARQFHTVLIEQDRVGWRPDVLMETINLIETSSAMQLANLRQLEDTFATSSSPALRRLALAALKRRGMQGEWDQKKLQRLQRFRDDHDPMVAAPAQFTFTDEEAESEEPADYDP